MEVELEPPDLEAELELDVVRKVIASLPDGAEKETVQLFYVEGEALGARDRRAAGCRQERNHHAAGALSREGENVSSQRWAILRGEGST